MGPKLQIEEPFLRNDFYKYEYEEALFYHRGTVYGKLYSLWTYFYWTHLVFTNEHHIYISNDISAEPFDERSP